MRTMNHLGSCCYAYAQSTPVKSWNPSRFTGKPSWNLAHEKHHLSVFQGLLVQLMHVLLFPSVSDVESLDGDIEVVLHVARIRDHSLEEKSS